MHETRSREKGTGTATGTLRERNGAKETDRQEKAESETGEERWSKREVDLAAVE